MDEKKKQIKETERQKKRQATMDAINELKIKKSKLEKSVQKLEDDANKSALEAEKTPRFKVMQARLSASNELRRKAAKQSEELKKLGPAIDALKKKL